MILRPFNQRPLRPTTTFCQLFNAARLINIIVATSCFAYFAGMLNISKGNISLQVYLRHEKVFITHVAEQFQNGHILATITRNEQLLARIHLSASPAPYTEQQLREYFKKRGWLVKENVPLRET